MSALKGLSCVLVAAACATLGNGMGVQAPRPERVPPARHSALAADDACLTAPDGSSIVCPHQTVTIANREVHYQLPAGRAPTLGWRAVILFQGSFHSAEDSWRGQAGQSHGALYQAQLVRDLLDGGYAVITPETRLDGHTFWDTNVLPFAVDWSLSLDRDLMVALLARLREGSLGPIDASSLFAAGISSGGYMASRVALAFPNVFSAIAIQSASYATCSGPLCIVPDEVPHGHPPTLFLHGDQDLVVPISTMYAYAYCLKASGVDFRIVSDPAAGHAWIAAAPEAVVSWFDAHPPRR